MLLLPFHQDKSSKFSMQIDLENDGAYTLFFFWNTRESAWFMDILDSTGETTYISGIRLVPEYALLKQYKGLPGIPKGDFFITDAESNYDGLDFDNIGVGLRFQMYYISKRELQDGI